MRVMWALLFAILVVLSVQTYFTYKSFRYISSVNYHSENTSEEIEQIKGYIFDEISK